MSDITYLDPCPTEDSTNCYYDAQTAGNGQGQSFIDIAGTTHLLNQPADSYILAAAVNPASPTGYSVAYQLGASEAEQTPAYAVDMTFPIVLVAAALIASVATLIVGFVRRDKVSPS